MSEVEVTLNGKAETLRCTLRAAKRVNSAGGMSEVVRKLQAFDMDAYVLVIAAALDKRPMDVEEAIYSTGLINLAEPVSTYVMLLANGGRPLAAQESDAPSGEA